MYILSNFPNEIHEYLNKKPLNNYKCYIEAYNKHIKNNIVKKTY